jgi:hypothetical protein
VTGSAPTVRNNKSAQSGSFAGKRYDEGCERLGLVRWNAVCCADQCSANAGRCACQGPGGSCAESRDQIKIVSTTDASEVYDLLADFRALYPRIETVYSKVNSNDIFNRIVDPPSSSEASGDVIWSSAMDLQVKLVNDGYAQPYVSREIAKIPDWAVWKNEAYAITAEPIVIVYNKNLVAESDIPRTRAELTNLLNKKPDLIEERSRPTIPSRAGPDSCSLRVMPGSPRRRGIWFALLAAPASSSIQTPERSSIGSHPASI